MIKHLFLAGALIAGSQIAEAQNFFKDEGAAGTAADFTMTSYAESGSVEINLQDELDAGKVVLLDYFFTTCFYCQYSTPELDDIYQELGPDGSDQLEIVSLDVKTSTHATKSIADFRTEFGANNPMFDMKAYGSYNTAFMSSSPYRNPTGPTSYGLPHFIVICQDGSWKSMHQADAFPATSSEVNASLRTLLDHCTINAVGTVELNDENTLSVTMDQAARILNLDYNSNSDVQVEVINILGSVSYSGTMNSEASIDVSALQSGIYFVSVIDGGDKMVEKVVIN
ncbi:MAG TPA: hypothetical protein DCS15_09675 [Flavobacteriales bacterium]|nr:hypothetical protein [Flavobacteriales bacterium]